MRQSVDENRDATRGQPAKGICGFPIDLDETKSRLQPTPSYPATQYSKSRTQTLDDPIKRLYGTREKYADFTGQLGAMKPENNSLN